MSRSPADRHLFAPRGDAGALTAFRWTDYDVPFWDRENSRPGRWNIAGRGSTQYWSLSPDAAWAELIRSEELTSAEELEHVRRPIWVARLPSVGLIDLVDPEVRDRYGISLAALTSDDWTECQSLGGTLSQAAAAGVIAPSAALENHLNVTIFGRRRAIDWSSRTRLASAIPAARVSIGRPPPGVLERVIPHAPRGGTLF